MAKAAKDHKTYILTLKNGNIRKVTVPGTWKMTYGSVVPYTTRRDNPGSSSDYALRFYEGNKENLRAVFCDVVSLRDESMSIMEKRTTVQRKAAQKHTNQGMKDVVVEARVTEWVNPDDEKSEDVPNEFLRLTHDED